MIKSNDLLFSATRDTTLIGCQHQKSIHCKRKLDKQALSYDFQLQRLLTDFIRIKQLENIQL